MSLSRVNIVSAIVAVGVGITSLAFNQFPAALIWLVASLVWLVNALRHHGDNTPEQRPVYLIVRRVRNLFIWS